MPDAKKWYYVRQDGQRVGPLELRRRDVEWGYLKRDTLVWTVGMLEWLPAEETELKILIDEVEMPPPLPVARPPEPQSVSFESEDERNGAEQPGGDLLARLAQTGVQRRHHDVERGQDVVGEVEASIGLDIDLGPL